jgi:hypothetical protein
MQEEGIEPMEMLLLFHNLELARVLVSVGSPVPRPRRSPKTAIEVNRLEWQVGRPQSLAIFIRQKRKQNGA